MERVKKQSTVAGSDHGVKEDRSSDATLVQLKGKSYGEQRDALSPTSGGYQQQQAQWSPNEASVQLKGDGNSSLDVHGTAQAGVQGSGGSLPHLDKIQSSFGQHDVSNVQAYSGAAAVKANETLGSNAYASGNAVAFKGSTDLHTAAHEAAHIVQQRAGVSLSGGVGKAGDAYEQHADAVADAVVQGKSAEGLLSQFAGPAASGGSSVQCKETSVQFKNKDEWGELVSHRPSTKTQQDLDKRGMSVHKIEKGWGPVNLDYYAIEVQQLPVINGRAVSPDWVVKQLHTNMNAFVDTQAGNFSAFNSSDAAKLKSNDSEGAVVHIDMGTQGRILRGTNVDDGSVVTSGIRTKRNKQNQAVGKSFIFSTIYAPGDANHPVSGNREFGYVKSGSGYTFFTRGADRCTTLMDYAMASIVFGSAHLLWLSFQRGLSGYINKNGGSATIGSYTSARYDWDSVKKQQHNPTQAWQEEGSKSSSRYIRSPDGTSIDRETGRMIMGPGPKY